jgi:gamma-glutamyltranspeptidase/glutathione hydrolase
MRVAVCLAAACGTLLGSCAAAPEPSARASAPPTTIGTSDFAAALKRDEQEFPGNPLATGTRGAITTTYHGTAALAGLEALHRGGSSVDAALTAALAQISLGAGAVISYFGILTMAHYDAASGETVTLNAGWNTVRAETDPMSIPGGVDFSDPKTLTSKGEPSGRTALVGGFMRGVEAAHRRYGKRPFAELFAPAIGFAAEGFTLPSSTAKWFEMRAKDLQRLPETRATLLKADGSPYVAGDLFRQPALARTLRAVAAEGADYMYRGAWAQRAVAAVQADGGKMTLEDLAAYEVTWSPPRRARYGDYELATLGPPNNGSVSLIEGLNLVRAAGIAELGHWSQSGESLRRMSDASMMFMLSFIPPATRAQIYTDLDLSDESRLRPETAAALWQRMERGIKPFAYVAKPTHSDTVVAVDAQGNMTAITHSINCLVWGKTAIVVDGVSIGDPAAFQQAQIALVPPGGRLPDPTEVGILSKDGKPVLAFASMATGLHQQTLQSLVNIMDFRMDVKQAVDAPALFLPLPDTSMPPKQTMRVMRSAFPREVLEASGLPYREIEPEERRLAQGLWIAVTRDPESGKVAAVSPPYANGRAFAH